jgi:hypothetical protein
MPDITDLTLDGAPPDRFVAIASPTTPLSILWAIDGNDEGRSQGLRYLAQVRSVHSGMGPLDMRMARRLMEYAGKAGVEPNLIYATVFALTELKGGRSVVIDTYDEPEVKPRA